MPPEVTNKQTKKSTSAPSRPTDQIVDEVGEGPDHRYADERDAEQDDVEEADPQDVREPHPPAVHHSSVGVHLAVRRPHVHRGSVRLNARRSSAIHIYS